MPRPPRYTDRDLPPYRHVPGRTPHPISHPDGHSYGRAAPAPPSLEEADWETCVDYLYGVDLFNACFWWECHEAFEELWRAAGRETPTGHCLQALIQCAVAHLKAETGNLRGARQLLAKAEGHAGDAGPATLGNDLAGLLSRTRAYVDGASEEPATLAPARRT